ncbi:MAG: sigma factor-like helix-turn-helix DNA-binding protein, partial [Flavitalea sp.]
SVAVKYRIINAQLKQKREQDYLQTQQESVFETDKWLDEQELQKYYSQLISELPEKCRITYKLSREEGMTLKEISNAMSISQKAVEANLTRSLILLRFGLKKIMFFMLWFLSAHVDFTTIFAGL